MERDMKRILVFIAFLLIASPSFAAAPSFSVNKNGTDQTVTAGAITKITWSNVVFDTTSNFSTANSRYTPNVAGKYLFTASAYCSDSNTQCSTWIYKNGSAVNNGFSGSSTYNGSINGGPIVAVNAVIDMNGTTDYVEAFVAPSGTTVKGNAVSTYFTGSFLTF
jgi:hypothetical protein